MVRWYCCYCCFYFITHWFRNLDGLLVERSNWKPRSISFIDQQYLADRLIAIDRVHRIGQEKTVHVKHFIVSSSFFSLPILGLAMLRTFWRSDCKNHRESDIEDTKAKNCYCERGISWKWKSWFGEHTKFEDHVWRWLVYYVTRGMQMPTYESGQAIRRCERKP